MVDDGRYRRIQGESLLSQSRVLAYEVKLEDAYLRCLLCLQVNPHEPCACYRAGITILVENTDTVVPQGHDAVVRLTSTNSPFSTVDESIALVCN